MKPEANAEALAGGRFAGLAGLRSRSTLALFTCSALVTALLARWGASMLRDGRFHGLSPIFSLLFGSFDVRASMWTLLTLMLALLVTGVIDGSRVARWFGEHVGAIAVATFLVLCVGTLRVYLDHPTAMDEYAQVLQARIFAGGALAGRFPPDLMDRLLATGFQNYFIAVSKTTGAVASMYWPSFALLLAPFVLAGAAWALNPLVSALTLLATHRLAWRIFGSREAAGWAVLLTLASPEFAINGISYYTMPAHLLANTVYALLLLSPTRGRAVLAGLVGSVALTLHNPVPHMLFALPWIVWTARRPDGWRLIGWLALGYLPLSLALGVGWFLFTGDLRHAGVAAAATSGGHATVDGLKWVLSAFSLPDARVLFARAIGVAKIWLWAAPGLMVLCVVGAIRAWHLTAVRVLVASAMLTLLGYFLVPVDQGHGWGYRYFHTAWVALPILAPAALAGASDDRRWWIPQGPQVRAFVAAGALLSLVIVLPVRAIQVHDIVGGLVAQVPDCAVSGRRVVLLDVGRMFYGADLVQNDPWLRGNEIRMISRGDADDAAMMAAHFPGYRELCRDERGSVWGMAAATR